MMEFNIEVWRLGKNKVQNFKNGRIDDYFKNYIFMFAILHFECWREVL